MTTLLWSCGGKILRATLNWWLGQLPSGTSAIIALGSRYLNNASCKLKGGAKATAGGRYYFGLSRDLLSVVAGVMHEPFPSFLLIAGFAKIMRYLMLTGITLGWLA